MAIERQWTRRLAWEGVLNARDLGGIPLLDLLEELGHLALVVRVGRRQRVDQRVHAALAAIPR